MKASVSPTAIALILFGTGLFSALAQDALVQNDGQQRDGQILGVKSGAIRLKVGPVETSVPMANVKSVTMAPPKAYNDALAAWQKGDAAATITLLKPLVENFIGLPTKWASRAASLLGDAYVNTEKITEAEKAFADFQLAYPDAAASADVGLARLAIAKKDYDTAREKLTPIVENAKKVLLPESGESAVFGQALLLMGEVQESAGENPAALENYLLASTVFREDKAVIAKADERANALKEKNVLAP